MKTIKVYTDGSCIVQTGIGGWAAVSYQEIICGSKTNTTNNEMELTATYYAALLSEDYDIVDIYTDSQYVYNTFMDWAYRWEQDDWKKKGGGQIKNLQLIQKIFKITKNNQNIMFHKVKAHNGNEWNDKADKIARKMAYREF